MHLGENRFLVLPNYNKETGYVFIHLRTSLDSLSTGRWINKQKQVDSEQQILLDAAFL